MLHITIIYCITADTMVRGIYYFILYVATIKILQEKNIWRKQVDNRENGKGSADESSCRNRLTKR